MAPLKSPWALTSVPGPSPIAKLVGVLVQPAPAPTPLIDAHVALAAPAPPNAAAASPDATAPSSSPPASPLPPLPNNSPPRPPLPWRSGAAGVAGRADTAVTTGGTGTVAGAGSVPLEPGLLLPPAAGLLTLTSRSLNVVQLLFVDSGRKVSTIHDGHSHINDL